MVVRCFELIETQRRKCSNCSLHREARLGMGSFHTITTKQRICWSLQRKERAKW